MHRMGIKLTMGPRLFAGIFVLLTLLTACQKKRSPEFIQGDGEYVYKIADFQGKTYPLETGKVTGPGVVTDADLLESPETSDILRSFPSVEFHSNIELTQVSHDDLNQLFVFGKPETEEVYQLQLGFTENHLIVYKLAKKSDIPSDELTFAIPAAGGLYQVPLFGYPLKKYVVDYVVDDRGKPTKQKRTISKDFLADSTHFSVDTSSVKVFTRAEKKNLLPTSFFNESNEWFYELSIVDGPLSTQIGAQLGAGKVRFLRTSNSLIAVDLNIPDEAKTLAGEKLQRIIELPVRWADFELIKTGDDAMLKELLLDEQDAGADNWQNRAFGLLDLKRLNNLDNASTNSVRVTRLEVDENYFSVTLSYSDLNGIALHYSFARSDRAVKGQVYPVADQRKYGFWRAIRNFYLGNLTSTEKNYAQNTFLSRMYPNENNVIEVYLTENTPDIPIFVDSIEKAIQAWDRTFVEAAKGTQYESNPIRVTLNRSRKVKNGDVRYNKISFYDFNINVGGLLGYGPSVTDDRTGEIHSSTNHIYLRTYREGVYRDLKNYIKAKLGFYDGKSLAGIEYPNQLLYNSQNIDAFDSFDSGRIDIFAREVGFPRPVASNVATESVASSMITNRPDLSNFQEYALEQLRNPKLAQAKYDALYREAKSKFEARRDLKNSLQKGPQGCSYQAAVFNTFREIEATCGSLKFGDYVRRLQAEKRDASFLEQIDYDAEIFNECAQLLLAPTLQSTLVHEFGHNLGMTHNFMGSADDANFRRDPSGVPTFRSTSVMDYPDRDEDRGFEPGTYDVAAIRYAYYQAVELKDHGANGKVSIVSVAPEQKNDTRSIEEKLSPEVKAQLKSYLYCWDMDIEENQVPLLDVRCRRWDRGSNPVQMAYSLIDQFNSTTAMTMSRFEMKSLSEKGFEGSVLQSVLLPLHSIYQQYRYLLYLKTRGLNDPYFFKSEAKYDEFIARNVGNKTLADLPKDPLQLEAFVEKLPEIQQYKLAADIIFKFFKQLVFVEDRYCTVWAGQALVDALPFSRLRQDVFTLSRVSINSCSELMPFFNAYRIESQVPGAAETDLNYELKKYLGSFAQAAWSVPVSVKDFGNAFETVTYSANDEELNIKAPLVIGTSGLRANSFLLLTIRGAGMPILADNRFFPNFMDDPNYRREFLREIEDRLLNGIDVAKLGVSSNLAGAQGSRFVQRFASERALLEGMYANFLNSLAAPGENSAARMDDLLPMVYSRADFLRVFPDPSKVAYIVDGQGRYFVAEKQGSTIQKMITTYRGVRKSIALTSMYDAIAGERQKSLEAATRVAKAYFVKVAGQPELQANDLKYFAVAEASLLLGQQFLKSEEVVSDANVPVPSTPSTAYVEELVKKASELLKVAVAQGLKVDVGMIESVLVDLTSLQPLEDRGPEAIVSGLLEDGDDAYLPVIYALIQGVADARDAEPNMTELSEDKWGSLAQASYDRVLSDFAKVKLSTNALSERAAQEGILLDVILGSREQEK